MKVVDGSAIFIDGKLVAGVGGGCLQMFELLSEATIAEIRKLVEFDSVNPPIPMEPKVV